MNYLVRGQDVIFNLAGQVSHIDSMRDPYTDLEINCRASCRCSRRAGAHNPAVKVVFAGTRQIYGRAGLPAGHRVASRAADRRQRHQQGRRRVLPPRLQQRLRRARLLAAADQRVRAAPAARNTTARASSPGSSGWRSRIARSRSTATARSCATSSTWTTRPMRFCAPAPAIACNGEVFNVGGARADLAPRRSSSC